MRLVVRFALWSAAAVMALGADILTKAAPHSVVVDHYAQTPAAIMILVSVFLCGLGLLYSNQLAVGAGLMFGGLCGNGGQLLLYGYASDWLPIGGWLTNVADICGAVGLVCCFTGYLRTGMRGRPHS